MSKYILFLVLIFFSCNKEDVDEYASGNSDVGIVGSWKLVQSSSMNSWGDVMSTDRSSENIIISFDSLGNAIYSKNSCKGRYTFTAQNDKKESCAANMIISFDCNNSNTSETGVEGKYNAVFRDNNYLIMNNVNCVEMCADEYRRLKN